MTNKKYVLVMTAFVLLSFMFAVTPVFADGSETPSEDPAPPSDEPSPVCTDYRFGACPPPQDIDV